MTQIIDRSLDMLGRTESLEHRVLAVHGAD